MLSNSKRPSHVAGIYGISQDFPKHKQFDLIQSTPPSSSLTTLYSSSITRELDATCPILTSHYPNTTPPSSSLINQSGTSSTPSRRIEILNSLATYRPTINYGSTNGYNISDGVWNSDEIYMEQEMNLDQNRSEFTGFMNFPDLMINAGHGLRHGSESPSYQPWLQLSQFDQQQRMGLMLDSNFPYYGSAIIGSGFAEDALLMEMGIQESSFDKPIQSDQINKLTYQGIVDREFEKRRNKKMKNRESAARSRLKKQAHVNYLEKKSWRLKRDNNLLNKEQVFLRSIPRTRLQLRRTSSCDIIENKLHF